MRAFPVDLRERAAATAPGRSRSEVQAAEVCAAWRTGVVKGFRRKARTLLAGSSTVGSHSPRSRLKIAGIILAHQTSGTTGQWNQTWNSFSTSRAPRYPPSSARARLGSPKALVMKSTATVRP